MRFVTEPQPLAEIEKLFVKLRAQVHTSEPDELKLLIKAGVPEYQPYLT